MQLNKNASHCFAAVYAAAMGVSASGSKAHLFVGELPSKPALDALTVAALANYAEAAAVSIGIPLFDESFILFDTMPIYVTSTLTGKLGWAAIESGSALAVVDVGAPNDGSVIQVSDVNVVAGSLIEVLSVTLRLAS